ncbi:MAG: DUF2065 domain-containing protein [Polaromonas sp.]|nr:DUF2065 domain-containing protein [Polaromonas sp.]
MLDSLWLALALVFIIEGLFPFVSPSAWRQTFTALLGLTDGQIRFFGLFAILLGLAGLVFLA